MRTLEPDLTRFQPGADALSPILPVVIAKIRLFGSIGKSTDLAPESRGGAFGRSCLELVDAELLKEAQDVIR